MFARSSAPAHGARALIRVCGPGVRGLASRLLDPPPPARGAHRARLRARGWSLPVLVARYDAPRSYTGEDVLEIVLPGNPALVERVLLTLGAAEGMRAAGPGEFTARAFLRGRLTLDQAEGVGALIAAATQDELDAARSLLSGQTGAAYRAWADELTTLLALVESGIDFTDQEDVRPIDPDALAARLDALRADVRSHVGAARGRASEDALPLVVLAGAPNAGKSTLFNALLGRRRAVASPHAGTTRDVLVESLDLSSASPGAGVVRLADLAGLDDTAGASHAPSGGVDALAQHAARETLHAADVVVWCDPTGRFATDARPPTPAPLLLARTFADQHATPSAAPVLDVGALDGRGLAALGRAIAGAVGSARAASLASLLPRHRDAMHELLDALDDAGRLSPRLAARPDEVAFALRRALDGAGALCGRVDADEVLGRVFASFCVGK
ncbi:MAG: GTPase [Planctomycetota bacterium]|nr:GTPase [Planctomycetota bacterium]